MDPRPTARSPISPPPGDAVVRLRGDRSLAVLRDGYRFVSRRLRELYGHGFDTRFLGRRAVFLSGPDAARQFYDNTKFTRVGAIPQPIRGTLFGKDTVHGLTDGAHHHRKAMFTAVMAPERVAELVDMTESAWRTATARWTGQGRIVLFDEAVRILGTAVCRWAGIPDKAPELEPHLVDMATIVDNFGAVGWGQVRARAARRRVNRWARGHIRAVRAGRMEPEERTALYRVARHRDRGGRLLPARVAADELINVLRPTIAVSWFVVFAAHALQAHSQWRHRLAWGDEDMLTAFANEVRRFYPFAPMVAARTRRSFHWLGHRFPKGRWVILDLYGTDHDSHAWSEPEQFDPQRFIGTKRDRFAFIPQGGGYVDTGHRCPGEDATVQLLSQAVQHLSRLDYRVPGQDLSFSYSRIPSRVRSGFVLADVSSTLAAPSIKDEQRVGHDR